VTGGEQKQKDGIGYRHLGFRLLHACSEIGTIEFLLKNRVLSGAVTNA
jgi:hypothetical protein